MRVPISTLSGFGITSSSVGVATLRFITPSEFRQSAISTKSFFVVPDLTVFNPGYDVQCKQCSYVGPGIILRKVGDPRNFSALCGRCLALALTEVTKQDFLSQFTMWQAVRAVAAQVKKELARGKTR